MHESWVANEMAGDQTFGAVSRPVPSDGRVNLQQ